MIALRQDPRDRPGWAEKDPAILRGYKQVCWLNAMARVCSAHANEARLKVIAFNLRRTVLLEKRHGVETDFELDVPFVPIRRVATVIAAEEKAWFRRRAFCLEAAQCRTVRPALHPVHHGAYYAPIPNTYRIKAGFANSVYMSTEELGLFNKAEEYAKQRHDGTLTVMRFTTNWRVAFVTPNSREDVDKAHVGETLKEALQNALEAEGFYG